MDKESKQKIRIIGDRALASVIGRGTILSFAADVEDLLTSIIAWCFSPTYQMLDGEIDTLLNKMAIGLKSIVLIKIDFVDKIAMLEQCARFSDEDVYLGNCKLIKEIVKELDKIRKFRNLLAHSTMDTSDEYAQKLLSKLISDNESFQVKIYKNGVVTKKNISSDELKTEIIRTGTTLHKLLQLWALLRRQFAEATEHETISTIPADEHSEILKRMGF
jgi:hypothetical protein